MIANGEIKIVKLVCCFRDGKLGLPCGACREFLMQLDVNSASIEILVVLNTLKSIMLGELMPNWWGVERFLN